MLNNNTSYRLIDPSDERWLTIVNSNPNATIFHHPAWVNLLSECYGYQPYILTAWDENGEVRAGLPLMDVNSLLTGRRWISLPYTDHCNPLYQGKTPPKELFEGLYKLKTDRDIPRIEIRSEIPSGDQVYKDSSQVLHLLKLSADAQEVRKNFHRSQVKRNIKKAEREGVEIRRAEEKNDLDIFYDLHLKTRHRLGVPVQPKLYFELLWHRIIGSGLGYILLAYKDSTPIAGAVFLTFNKNLVYKYGASDSNYWQLRPNHLLFWTAIRWGCEHAYRIFDWGKTKLDNKGLRNFKDGWGSQESILTYSFIAPKSPNHTSDRLTDTMEAVIRHSPKLICRVSGELLYKHFA